MLVVKEEENTILHFIFINNENSRLDNVSKEIRFEVAGICFDLWDKEDNITINRNEF